MPQQINSALKILFPVACIIYNRNLAVLNRLHASGEVLPRVEVKIFRGKIGEISRHHEIKKYKKSW
jgi:hypothetical protein